MSYPMPKRDAKGRFLPINRPQIEAGETPRIPPGSEGIPQTEYFIKSAQRGPWPELAPGEVIRVVDDPPAGLYDEYKGFVRYKPLPLRSWGLASLAAVIICAMIGCTLIASLANRFGAASQQPQIDKLIEYNHELARFGTEQQSRITALNQSLSEWAGTVEKLTVQLADDERYIEQDKNFHAWHDAYMKKYERQLVILDASESVQNSQGH